LASGGLAVTIAATMIAVGVVLAFRGSVVVTFLGDAVALQVRSPDLLRDELLCYKPGTNGRGIRTFAQVSMGESVSTTTYSHLCT
jgi:hypothetical protein